MPNIVTGSTCSLQEPPPPVPHGNSGTYSTQPVLITAGHTSNITVSNTLDCLNNVSEHAHGQQQ
jgi:hypothetical protein